MTILWLMRSLDVSVPPLWIAFIYVNFKCTHANRESLACFILFALEIFHFLPRCWICAALVHFILSRMWTLSKVVTAREYYADILGKFSYHNFSNYVIIDDGWCASLFSAGVGFFVRLLFQIECHLKPAEDHARITFLSLTMEPTAHNGFLWSPIHIKLGQLPKYWGLNEMRTWRSQDLPVVQRSKMKIIQFSTLHSSHS